MKKYLSIKYLTSICFLTLIGIMLLCSLVVYAYVAYLQLRSTGTISLSQMEYDYNVRFPGKSFYVSMNGGFQRIMGKRYVNERYRLDNGHLTYVIEEEDVTAAAEHTVAFRDSLNEMGIPFGYVSTMFQVDAEDKQLPVGVEDYSNENTDRFLKIMRDNSVEVLDLRQRENEQGLDHYSLFYRTDHHWTAEAGFWAYTQVVDWLTSLDSTFKVDETITEAESYDYAVYKNVFCGSGARRVGMLYVGVDDITLISPRFDTYLEYEAPEDGIYREGTYKEALIFSEFLTRKEMMKKSAYNAYLGSERMIVRIKNDSRRLDLETKCTPKKLLIVKDSSSLVVAPFLALSYDEICLVDMRQFTDDLLEYIQNYQPDMVMVMYNPGALTQSNLNMYQFVK